MKGVKRMIKGWLEIDEGDVQKIKIKERFNFDTNAVKNRIWMRGDPIELDQLYKQFEDNDGSFWGSVPQRGNELRKIHTGLPSIMVDVLTNVVVRDMNDIDACDEWKDIAKENGFKEIVKQAITDCLYLGDGAFKISFEEAISKLPIIEFIPADEIDIEYERGRYKETIFKKNLKYKGIKYLLKERYGFGYVKYNLYKDDVEVELNSIPETASLKDVKFAGYDEVTGARGSFNMAIPMMFSKSTKWKGRGKSIFDSKTSAYDALDEIVSQWADAVRSGRAVSYIPESLIPKDPMNGSLLRPNGFDVRYIKVDDNANENGKNEIDVKQPTIPSANYLESYITYLDICMQGIISPSTLGIDVKKLDNAEAQREKEKTTLYTRNNIIETLQRVLPNVINSTLKALDVQLDKEPRNDIEVNIDFGEYANPSFEATVETVSKAKSGGIMSIEASVDELYGDSKDDDWKVEEVKRLKEEQGIAELEEPVIDNVIEGGTA